MEHIKHIKPKQIRRKFADDEERRRLTKARHAENRKTRICIGKENLAEWHRQKALCGLATSVNVEFVSHLLALHEEYCATSNDAKLKLNTETNISLELNAAYAQQEAARMSNCSHVTSITEVTTDVKGVLPKVTNNDLEVMSQRTTNDNGVLPQVTNNYLEVLSKRTTNDNGVLPRLTNNDLEVLSQRATNDNGVLPQVTNNYLEVLSQRTTNDNGVLPQVTNKNIEVLSQRTTNELLAVPQETTNALAEEAVTEIKAVSDVIESWAEETSNRMEIQETTNEVDSQDEETKVEKSQILQEENLAPGNGVCSNVLVARKLIVDGSRNDVRTKYHLCKPCQRAFSDTEIKNHLLSHFKGNLNHCAQCVEGFTSTELVEEHVLKHMGLNINVLHMEGSKMKYFEVTRTVRGQSNQVLEPTKSVQTTQNEDKHQSSTPSTSDLISCPALPLRMNITAILNMPKCKLCGEGFESWEDVATHLYVHNEETPYQCDMCEKYFRAPGELSTHETNVCGNPVYTCGSCIKVFKTRNALRRHELKHTSVMMQEVMHNTLTIHKVVKNKTSTPSADVIPPPTDPVLTTLNVAGKQQNPTLPTSKFMSPVGRPLNEDSRHILDQPEELVVKSNRSYECTLCGENSKSWQEARRHGETHNEVTRYNCGTCSKYFRTQDKLSEHETELCVKRQQRQHKCGSCKRVFRRKEALQKHELVHSKTRYICDKCGKQFQSASNLKVHMYKHTGLWPYKCTECGRGCCSKTELIRHMEIHADVPSHVCPTCGKGFHSRGYLQTHQVVHKEDRPFKCRICEKAFKSNCRAKAHERSHTAQRKHECTVCGLSFKNKVTLSRHMWTHSSEGRNHKCSQCGKLFNTSSDVQRHMLTHTKERPYKCEVCGDAFQQKGHLATHMMGHTGEWSHKCGLCGKGFGNPGHLSKHMGTKHGST